ncbi:patatin [Antarcticibacterium sp. 1MA-6-2]|uniref:patatin n=1 Tax=Antarcticibacterium sp. 1MA-6-2 TaxID=2908210 RepID=UPI002883097A|nr:patatin [Antarcticibacterium sp. 1MA-6-2]
MDGKILTDGGVTNNYPVEELKNRGAEIVIGVDVQDTLMTREQLRSVFDILTQISNFRTISDMKDKVELTEVYIKPEISKYSVLSFEQGTEIIKAGEEAAREKMAELEKISATQEENYSPVKKSIKLDNINIDALSMEGSNTYPRAYIQGKLRLRYNSRYTLKDLNKGVNNLAATGNFNRINYNLIPNDSTYTLALQVEESRSKSFLRLALHYDDLYKSGALINFTRKSNFFTNDVASLDVVLGDNFRYNFHYYIDKGYYWSVGVRSRYSSFDKGVASDLIYDSEKLPDIGINRIEVDYQDITNQIYLETLFQQIFSFGVGVEHKFLKITSETLSPVTTRASSPAAVFDHSNYYSAFGFLLLDSYDNKYFPNRGVYFEGSTNLYLLSSRYKENFDEFSITRGSLGYVFSPHSRITGKISSEVGFRIGTYSNNTLNFFLGGYGNAPINNLIPFYGYDFIDISGDSYIKSLLEVDFEFFRRNHLIASANFANVDNNLFGSGNWLTLPEYSGYALGYGLETIFGPVEVKYSYSPELSSSQWFFSLGFWF